MKDLHQLKRGDSVLIFGAGQFAQAVASALGHLGIEVAAFISSEPTRETLSGRPIKTWSSLQGISNLKTLPLLCGIFNRDHAYQDLDAIARSHGFEAMLMPWQYYPALAEWLGWRYWLTRHPETLAPIENWPTELHHVHALLADEESRELLRRIVAFRAGMDLSFSKVRSSEAQYFNALTLAAAAKRDDLVYFDVGAYDGDTLREISSQVKLSRAMLFEPCPNNLQRLKGAVETYMGEHPDTEVEIMPLALSNCNGHRVLAGQGEAATVSTDAPDITQAQELLVHTARADDLYPSLCVDFVKIDAEGTDLSCIQGMPQLLSRSQPAVAATVYHRDLDLIDIPLALANILGIKGYRYHLRQHHFNSFDCVFYAVPKT